MVLEISVLMHGAIIEADTLIDLTMKKLTIGTEISISIVEVSIFKVLPLKYVLYIYYPMQFKKDQSKIQVFLDFFL